MKNYTADGFEATKGRNVYFFDGKSIKRIRINQNDIDSGMIKLFYVEKQKLIHYEVFSAIERLKEHLNKILFGE